MQFLTNHPGLTIIAATVFVIVVSIKLMVVADKRWAKRETALIAAKRTEIKEQEALAVRFVEGDETAYDELASRPWKVANPKDILASLERFTRAKADFPSVMETWRKAIAEVDTDKRYAIIHEMQQEEYEDGGNIIAYFQNLIDGHAAFVKGAVSRPNLLNFDHFGRGFKNIWLDQ